jgi:hypothetical protein
MHVVGSNVRVLGFEPRTSALSELRSSQLSYTRNANPFSLKSLVTHSLCFVHSKFRFQNAHPKREGQTALVWPFRHPGFTGLYCVGKALRSYCGVVE